MHSSCSALTSAHCGSPRSTWPVSLASGTSSSARPGPADPHCQFRHGRVTVQIQYGPQTLEIVSALPPLFIPVLCLKRTEAGGVGPAWDRAAWPVGPDAPTPVLLLTQLIRFLAASLDV